MLTNDPDHVVVMTNDFLAAALILIKSKYSNEPEVCVECVCVECECVDVCVWMCVCGCVCEGVWVWVWVWVWGRYVWMGVRWEGRM